MSTAGFVAVAIAGALGIALGRIGSSCGGARRRSASRASAWRHSAMTARFVLGKVLGALGTLVFVLVFNFFLFRIVETDPVATLFRGRNLTRQPAGGADAAVRARRLDARAVLALPRSRRLQLNLGRSYATQPAGAGRDLGSARPRRSRSSASATVLSIVLGLMMGISAGWQSRHEPGPHADDDVDRDVVDARVLGRDDPADVLRRAARALPDRRDLRSVRGGLGSREAARPGVAHGPCRA